MTTVHWLLLLAIAGMWLCYWASMTTVGDRAPTLTVQCKNNLKQFGLALHNYHDEFRCFPPAYIADSDGKPMHSWRVLILPYMEERALYQAYNFSVPWNHPSNTTVKHVVPRAYCCPKAAREGSSAPGYLAVAGPNTIWPGAGCCKLGDVTNDKAKTLMLMEVADSGIAWTEPRDLTVADLNGDTFANWQTKLGSHRARFHALFVDGTVNVLPSDITLQTLLQLSTIAGGEFTAD